MRAERAGAALAILLLHLNFARAADVRDFAPDRPSRSDSPFTLPAGYFQAESDLATYTDTGAQFQALDPTLKYGTSQRTDLEIQIGGLVSQRQGQGRVASFGDVTVRVKMSLLGDDGGPVAITVIPYMKAPTARAPIGNGQPEGGINAPMLFSLPYDIGLTIEPELALLKNANTNAKQASATGVINAGRKIAGDLSGFVEVYAQTYADRQTPGPTVTFDTGLSYLLTKTLQIDAGASFGLNHATPGVNVYSGIAARF